MQVTALGNIRVSKLFKGKTELSYVPRTDLGILNSKN